MSLLHSSFVSDFNCRCDWDTACLQALLMNWYRWYVAQFCKTWIYEMNNMTGSQLIGNKLTGGAVWGHMSQKEMECFAGWHLTCARMCNDSLCWEFTAKSHREKNCKNRLVWLIQSPSVSWSGRRFQTATVSVLWSHGWNGWTDLDAICKADSYEPNRNHILGFCRIQEI